MFAKPLVRIGLLAVFLGAWEVYIKGLYQTLLKMQGIEIYGFTEATFGYAILLTAYWAVSWAVIRQLQHDGKS